MSAWDPCTTEHIPWLHFIECHPGFAAYLQAVGIILTLALAIFGPPLTLFWTRARDWWARRLNTIHIARTIRGSVLALIEQIEERIASITSADTPRPPWRGGPASDAMIKIPNGLLAVPYEPYADGARLQFLQNLSLQTSAFNSIAMTMTTVSLDKVYQEDWPMLRDQARSALADLEASAREALKTIDAMKPYPWSRTRRVSENAI